jgi:hypothetical protein
MHGMPDFVDGQLLGLLQLPSLIEGLFLKEEVDLAGRIQEVVVLQQRNQ